MGDRPDRMHDPFYPNDGESPEAGIFARVASLQERSAKVLRASGRRAAADDVEELAAVARDRVAHPAAVVRMYELVRRVRDRARLDEAYEQALDGAIALLAADFGNLQLAHPHTHALRLACQRGFDRDFLEYFADVADERTACGRAARHRTQAVIADVVADPGFAAHRDIAAAAGFRAVQSTPLIDAKGRLRGVLSTHFEHPHRPEAHELRMTKTYARLVADAIAGKVEAA